MADAVRTVDYTIEEGCLIPATPNTPGFRGASGDQGRLPAS